MKTGTKIAIILGVLAAAAGAYFFFSKKGATTTTNTDVSDEAKEKANKVTFQEALTLGGEVLKAFLNTRKKEVPVTKDEFILMGDQVLSWDRLYTLGSKYGMTKVKVEEIVRTGRPTFGTISTKYPQWKDLISSELQNQGIEMKDTPGADGSFN